jgi:hypothetical protein
MGILALYKTTKDVHFCTLLRSSSVSKIDEFRLSTRMRSGASVILWQIGLPQNKKMAQHSPGCAISLELNDLGRLLGAA